MRMEIRHQVKQLEQIQGLKKLEKESRKTGQQLESKKKQNDLQALQILKLEQQLEFYRNREEEANKNREEQKRRAEELEEHLKLEQDRTHSLEKALGILRVEREKDEIRAEQKVLEE